MNLPDQSNGMKLTKILVILLAFVFSVSSAQANLLYNGSLTISGGNGDLAAGNTVSQLLPDWTAAITGSTGVGYICYDQAATPTGYCGNTLQGSITASPDGGTFLVVDGDSQYNGEISQTVSGLTVGDEYLLTFYQASSQGSTNTNNVATTEQWKVTFGSTTQDSQLMSTPLDGSTPWTQQTMTFVADSTSDTLTFQAIGGPMGAPPAVLLDGISLTQQTPEPASASLLVGGLGLILTGILLGRLRTAVRGRTELSVDGCGGGPNT